MNFTAKCLILSYWETYNHIEALCFNGTSRPTWLNKKLYIFLFSMIDLISLHVVKCVGLLCRPKIFSRIIFCKQCVGLLNLYSNGLIIWCIRPGKMRVMNNNDLLSQYFMVNIAKCNCARLYNIRFYIVEPVTMVTLI